MDPILYPGLPSGHVHVVQGGNAFSLSMTDDQALKSTCTTSLVKNDKSNYWTPALYFQDPKTGEFEAVELAYMQVYYFFEATTDEIKAFPPGLQIVVGDPELRTPPVTGGRGIHDLADGAPQPVQWTCPRSDKTLPLYPVDSDGRHGVGIQDPKNAEAGVGFPDQNCDGFASPLRADIHFPSCYNPAAGLRDYKNNMQFTTNGNCPKGWIHVPHLFYEVYWNTPAFASRWTPGKGTQPFVLSNGDPTGYSLHGDFISGWDVETLQQIIDNCNTGTSAIDTCPGLIGGLEDPSSTCSLPNPFPGDIISGIMSSLPGKNPIEAWGSMQNALREPAKALEARAVTSSLSSIPVFENTLESPMRSHISESEWSYLGCYSNTVRGPRFIPSVVEADLETKAVSNSNCITSCHTAGYAVAGTEFGNHCFCTNSLSSFQDLPASACNMTCAGNSAQICGGSRALSVYSRTPSDATS
ncbi:hypothetical protein K3495_g1978 [Podosphaera aphanis]|nr:hypothetical protein K3495_g1978 [Podosphaera aphanis]